jgi:hypothetical protein
VPIHYYLINKFRYFPLIPRIRRLFRNKFFASNLKHGMKAYNDESRRNGDFVHDVHNAPAWQHVVNTLGNSERNLAFGLSADGALTGHYGRGTSVTPIVLSCLNLPSHIRSKAEYLIPIGIPPLNSKKMNIYLGMHLYYLYSLLSHLHSFHPPSISRYKYT